ncbi:MAG: phage tail tip lysozyme [Candidatus Limivicinus sp.]|jgi:hypothetical protein
MSNKTIYTALIRTGLSRTGACGLMGNMRAESGMRANNAQNGMTAYSDADYTAAVDNGTYTIFVTDLIGYGLCQWTHPSRKAKLLAFARARGVSIGDEDMQVQFAVKELQTDFPALWRYLTTCTGVYEAAAKVCVDFEKPAIKNIEERGGYANEFYCNLCDVDVDAADPEPEPAPAPAPRPAPSTAYWPPRELAFGMTGADVLVLQTLLIARCNAYLDINSNYGKYTREAVVDFQRAQGLRADGIAGKNTWKKLLEVQEWKLLM